MVTPMLKKQHAQQLWSDFLSCFGINAGRVALFERRADRSDTGNTGFIDFFMPAMVIGEAKSLGRDLNKAQEQIDAYLAGGSLTQAEQPKYSIVTDFEHFKLTRLDKTAEPVEFTIDQAAEHYDFFLFLIGKENITKQEEEEASIQAAELMAQLSIPPSWAMRQTCRWVKKHQKTLMKRILKYSRPQSS